MFKIGDLVKRTGTGSYFKIDCNVNYNIPTDEIEENIWVVDDIVNNGDTLKISSPKSKKKAGSWDSNKFALVENVKDTDIKIGDKVKIVKDSTHSALIEYTGKIGVVKNINNATRPTYEIKFDTTFNGRDNWWFAEDEIELVVEEEKTMGVAGNIYTKEGIRTYKYNGVHYNIMDNLKNNVQGEQYIRANTKEDIYRGIVMDDSNVCINIAKSLYYCAWFKENYKGLYNILDEKYHKKEEKSAVAHGGNAVELDLSKLESVLEKINEGVENMKRPTTLETEMINAIIEKGKTLATKELEKELVDKLDAFIKDTYGAIPSRMEIKIADAVSIKEGFYHEKFKDITTMVQNGIPVMLTGPAGTGKNHTLMQVADALGLDFYYTSSVTQEYKLTGYEDANGKYHETEFYKAFTKGGLFMLDEVDASSPDVLVLLNGAIANGYFDFPCERAKAHKDFRVVCAGNTFGTGADMIYVGRNVLDGATLDRFVVIQMDYDSKVEQMLCPDEELYNFIIRTRKEIKSNNLRMLVGMRASINGYKALQTGMSKRFVVESIIFKGVGKDDLNLLINKMDSFGNSYVDALKSYAKGV